MQTMSGLTQETLRLKADLEAAKKPEAVYRLDGVQVEAIKGRDTLWLKITRGGLAGLVVRTLFAGGEWSTERIETVDSGISCVATNEAGRWDIDMEAFGERLMRVRVTLTPATDLLIPYWPRDLYVLGENDDPTRAEGNLEASQRGLNVGVCFLFLNDFGRVMYVQNLSALNDYFAATGTNPDSVVGGEWPELGYQPPASPNGNEPPTSPLKAGQSYIVSDALISFREDCARDETASARDFVDMIAEIYPFLDKPEPEFHDWPTRAEKTLHDLKTAREASLKHYGHTYLHPYTASEYPDSMVQMSVAAALDEYENLTGKRESFMDELMKGMGRFYDDKLGTLRRYLPNVGDDKDADAVDSWYLYHPLMNLGRLAIRGHELAKELFLKSLDYGIRAGRHFKYLWPIKYNLKDFSVITLTRGDGYGQTDVAGLYAYVMLQAHQLTGDRRYYDEAKAALKVTEGMRFSLLYQANLTAWGIAACIRLWKLEEDERYLAQAEVYLASFVHNTELWDSRIGHARHYNNFFGVTCLHDAPYMAAYECFEAFSAFDEALQHAGDHLSPKMKLLLAEYRRFAFDRSWSYYPDALPKEAVESENIRNGHNDRKLSFPLEDLYGDGQPAGQVGQEIYGCGGAFIIANRGFYDRDIPFKLFIDYPYSVVLNNETAQITMRGPPEYKASVHLLPKGRKDLPDITVTLVQPDPSHLRSRKGEKGGRLYLPPADSVIRLSWR